MKRLSFIVFLFSAMLFADTTNVSGNVSGNWTTANSPYIVTNNLVLQPLDTLTINAGVEIRFDGNYRFDIFGTFLAVGTEADSITFTRNSSTNWMSLNFADDADDNSQMQYCIVEYGSQSGYDPYWGVINFNASSPTISNCRISDCSGDGIYLHYSEGEVSNNLIKDISSEGIKLNESTGTITGNTLIEIWSTSIWVQENSDSTNISNNTIQGGYWYGIYADNSSSLTISQNQITNKSSHGIKIYYECSYSSIDSNTITGNNGQGIYLYRDNYNLTIKNNIITDNDSYGIECYRYNELLTIKNNTITGHSSRGIWLDENNYYVTIENNIITDNTNTGIYFNYRNYNATIQNNTIAEHTNTGIHFDNQNNGDIIGNLIYDNGNRGLYLNNISNNDCQVRNNTIDGHAGYGFYWKSDNAYWDVLVAKNNSITNNETGIYCDNGYENNTVAYNNCWNNSSSNYSGSGLPTGTGNLTDINANGIVSDIYYNIAEYPLYVDQVNGDFNLQEGSPNIDAGDPSYSDLDGSVADIGYAYFYQSIPSINFSPESVNLNRVLIGADTTLTLQVYNPGDSTLTWSVSPDSAWVTVSPASGSVASGDTTALTVTLSTSALLADTYTPALVFTSNDPDSPTFNYIITIRIVNSWRVTFSASAGGLTDDNNILGFDEDATDGLDSDWDEPEPPPAPVNYLQVGFLHPAWSSNITFYAVDIRNYRALYDLDVEVWACSLSTDLTSTTATLALAASSNFPDGYSLWVIDGSDTTDVTSSGTYSLSITSGSASFGVMVKGVVPDAPVITITQPVEGQILLANQSLTINWTAQNTIEYYDVSYSTDGQSWSTIASSLDDATTSYIWTVPSGVHSTETYLKVFADGAGSTSSFTTVGPLAIIPTSLTRSFTEGWNLYSLPLVSSNGQTLGTVFNSSLPTPHYTYRLDGTNGYELVEDEYTADMDEGYWLALYQDASATLGGTALLDTSAISLSQGWNIVGCPKPFDVDTSALKVVSGTDTLGFTAAVGSGLLASSVIYSWNDSIRSYSSDSYLSDWNGHWLSAQTSDLTLLVYPQFRTDSSSSRARINMRATESNWLIHFDAEIDGISDLLTDMGVAPDATAGFEPLLDLPAPPEPPGGDFILAYFSHPTWNPLLGERYNADIQDPLTEGETRTWTITVDGNTSDQVQLTWGTLSADIPDYYTAFLTIENTGTVVNMRDINTVTLAANFPQDLSIEIHAQVLSTDDIMLPNQFALHQNYPNPFNPTTTLRYDLPENGLVNITVYDMLGRQVKTLINQTQDAGYRSIIWDATNDYGRPVSAGIYLYQIQAGEYMQTKKMVLLK